MSATIPSLHPRTANRGRHRLFHPFVLMPLVAALGIGIWWFAFRPSTTTATATPATSQLVTATSGAMSQTVTASGTVAAEATDSLSFTASGTVTAVNVKAGDTVTAGQVLATIDSAELQAAVTKAQATAADAQSKVTSDVSSRPALRRRRATTRACRPPTTR